MTHPRQYAFRMAAFLAAVVIVALVVHERALQFFGRNPPLNALILTVLGIGIALSFGTVRSLAAEVARIERYRSRGEWDADGGSSLLAPLAGFLGRRPAALIVSPTALRSILDGIDARLDERRDTSRYLIALLVFLGLLGTFWGLLLTASSVGETIRALNVESTDPAQMFGTLRAGLEAPLGGMGTAFSTSLFGLASSLILGFLDLQASQAQGRFASELETWLAGLASPAVDDDGRASAVYVAALLEQTADGLDKLERRLSQAADDTDRLREAMRAHMASLEAALARSVVDAAQGRDRAIDEIRDEIRLLARVIAKGPERGA